MRRAILCACLPVVLIVGLSATGIALISVSDEITLGREAQKGVRAQIPAVGGAPGAYVSGIGRRLAAAARGPKYPYSFSIANYREINAFALPGGPVWVHRGAIQAAKNESQLAGVLAHEIAHIAQRHAADQISKGAIANGLLGLLGAVLGNSGGARTAQSGAEILAGGYMMKFSRDDERDADRVGVEIMRRAGWDARGMLEFMHTLRAHERRNPGSVEVFLSTHPSPADREEQIRAQLRGVRGGGRRDSAEFQRIHAALAHMAPARAMTRR
jgi:beta-barrel assembly-enhancing protease